MAPKRKNERPFVEKSLKKRNLETVPPPPPLDVSLIKKAVSVILQTDPVYIPSPVIGIVTDYLVPHDFKEMEVDVTVAGIPRIRCIKTDKVTGYVVLVGSTTNETILVEYDVNLKKLVKIHGIKQRAASAAHAYDFDYSYSANAFAINRLHITDGSIKQFVGLQSSNTSNEQIVEFLPSTDPDVVYALRSSSDFSNTAPFFDRLEMDPVNSRCIAEELDGITEVSWRMVWNMDHRLLPESEIWMVRLRYVLHGHSMSTSNGKRRTSFKTPNSILCISSTILPLSSGIILFYASDYNALSPPQEVYAIDPMTSETNPVYTFNRTIVTWSSHVHEPSHTLFFYSYDGLSPTLNLISLPSGLFPCQKCPCGCQHD
jgi:hypothetical protein